MKDKQADREVLALKANSEDAIVQQTGLNRSGIVLHSFRFNPLAD